MHYYTFHPAKFNHETKMLSRLERAIYRELIDEYTGQEKPLVGDFDKIAWRLAVRSDDEKNALKVVLDNFFVLKTAKNGETHYHHPRLDAEIRAYRWHKKGGTLGNGQGTDGTEQGTDKERKQRYNQERKHMMNELVKLGVTLDKSVSMADLRSLYVAHVGTDNGTLGNGRNKNGTDKERTERQKSDVKQETINNKPVTSNKESKSEDTLALKNSQNQPRQAKAKAKTEFDAKTYPIGDSIDPDLWNDFVDMRLSIKKPLTEMACKRFVSDFEAWAEEGLSPNLAIAESIKNSWQGIFREKAVMPKIKNSRSFHDELAELEQNNHWGDDFYSRNRTANQAPIFEQPQIGVHS